MKERIKLVKLPMGGIYTTYARAIPGEYRVIHYNLSLPAQLAGGLDPLALTMKKIQETEGKDVEFEFYHWEYSNKSLEVKEIKEFDKKYKDIIKELAKCKTNSTLYIKRDYFFKNRLEKLFFKLGKSITELFPSISRFLSKFTKFLVDPEAYYIQTVHPVQYISVKFEEKDVLKAVEALMADLRILKDKDMILGHLQMPSIIKLADTLGAGINYFVLCCFPIVDYSKHMKVLKEDAAFYKNPLKEFGLKYSAQEGEVGDWVDGINVESKYTIEKVNLLDIDRETCRQAYVSNYLETVDEVNDISKKAHAHYEEMKTKLVVESEHKFEENKVEVRIGLKE